VFIYAREEVTSSFLRVHASATLSLQCYGMVYPSIPIIPEHTNFSQRGRKALIVIVNMAVGFPMISSWFSVE